MTDAAALPAATSAELSVLTMSVISVLGLFLVRVDLMLFEIVSVFASFPHLGVVQ